MEAGVGGGVEVGVVAVEGVRVEVKGGQLAGEGGTLMVAP